MMMRMDTKIIKEDNLMEENMVPSSVGSEHRVQRHEKYFVSAGITGGLSL